MATTKLTVEGVIRLKEGDKGTSYKAVYTFKDEETLHAAAAYGAKIWRCNMIRKTGTLEGINDNWDVVAPDGKRGGFKKVEDYTPEELLKKMTPAQIAQMKVLVAAGFGK